MSNTTISKESVRQYAVATAVSATVMATLSLYLFVRRGYFTLTIANKAIAATALVVLGIVLLIGPLCRVYDRLDRWAIYRKELGILAFIASAIHVYLSMFPLSRGGPFGFYLARPAPAAFGLFGLLLMIGLFIISFESIKNRLGASRWWKLQYRGVRLAGIAAALHLAVLKAPGWIDWWNGRFPTDVARPSLPPASLLAALFAVFVLLVRLSEVTGRTTARYVIPFLFFLSVGAGALLFLR